MKFCAYCTSDCGPFTRDEDGYLSCARCNSVPARYTTSERPAYICDDNGAPITSAQASEGARRAMGNEEHDRVSRIRQTWGIRIPKVHR